MVFKGDVFWNYDYYKRGGEGESLVLIGWFELDWCGVEGVIGYVICVCCEFESFCVGYFCNFG